MAKFNLNDDSVVVIIGSGAGGGTLGNELAQKGVKAVILEAGPRTELQDFINNEWESFTQLAWTDMRTTSGDWRVARDFPNLPAWIVKSVGGSTVHWAGASLRFEEHEVVTVLLENRAGHFVALQVDAPNQSRAVVNVEVPRQIWRWTRQGCPEIWNDMVRNRSERSSRFLSSSSTNTWWVAKRWNPTLGSHSCMSNDGEAGSAFTELVVTQGVGPNCCRVDCRFGA